MKSNEQILRERILDRSYSTEWEAARLEWRLEQVTMCSLRHAVECLCTHFPIVELCHLRNERTGATAIVGNVCVQRFLGIPSAVLFRGFKRIGADPRKAASSAVIEYAARSGWLDEHERAFCERTIRKRNLSGPDMAMRMRINGKLSIRTRDAEHEVQTRLNAARAT